MIKLISINNKKGNDEQDRTQCLLDFLSLKKYFKISHNITFFIINELFKKFISIQFLRLWYWLCKKFFLQN